MKSIKQRGDIMVPVAIVIAAVIIALAVMFTNKGGENGAPTSAADQLSDLAVQIGVDKKDFDSCMTSGRYNQKINDQIKQASDAGARGTPNSILITPKGNTIAIEGAQPYEVVKAAIDAVLNPETDIDNQNINIAPVTEDDHIRGGNVNSPVKLVEFSDIDCPFCKRFHTTMKQVVAEYGDQVAWVYRHFPIAQLHPDAARKAHATECVAELAGDDKFWEYLDILSVE